MHTYKIKEENPNFEKVVIEKGNISHTFTIADINEEQAALKKYIREFKSNRDIKKSVMENIEKHHEYVKELDAEKLFTIHMYQDAKDFHDKCVVKIEEFEKQLSESEAEVVEIIKQIGVTPEQVTNG